MSMIQLQNCRLSEDTLIIPEKNLELFFNTFSIAFFKPTHPGVHCDTPFQLQIFLATSLVKTIQLKQHST